MTNKKSDSSTSRSLLPRHVVITLAGALLAIFLASLDGTVVGTAMPRIIADLGGFSQSTWVATAYIAASTVTVPIVGKLTDMYGRKWFYVIGIVIFTIGSLMCGFSQTMGQLIAFRGFQGIGGGMIIANTFIVVGDLFPPAERGKYQGLVSGVFALSSVIGPPLGGFVTDYLSWHWVFFVNIPLGILILGLFIFFFPQLRPAHSRYKIDLAGAMTLMLFVIPIMLALSWGGVEYGWSSSRIIGLFSFSAIMLMLFIFIETRAEEPIIPLGIFKNRVLTVSILVIFITGFAMFGSIFFVPWFFQWVLDMKATSSGVFLTPMMLGVLAGSITSGQILSRTGGHYRIQGIFGLTVIGIGMALLSQMNTDTSYGQAVFNIVLLGFGLGSTMPLYVIAVQNAVPYAMMGTVTSQTVFFRQMGGAIGLAIFNSVMNNSYSSEFSNNISAEAEDAISPAFLDTLSHNPQALLNTSAEQELKDAISNTSGSDGEAIFQEVIEVIRESLNSAIGNVFLIGLLVITIAWVINLFIKEIPLRKQNV